MIILSTKTTSEYECQLDRLRWLEQVGAEGVTPPPFAPKSGQAFAGNGRKTCFDWSTIRSKKRAFDDKCDICFNSVGPDGGYFHCNEEGSVPHVFHNECLKKWKKTSRSKFECLLCSTVVLQDGPLKKTSGGGGGSVDIGIWWDSEATKCSNSWVRRTSRLHLHPSCVRSNREMEREQCDGNW